SVDRVRSSKHNDSNASLFTTAHTKVHDPDESVVACTDVLEINKQNVDILQHLRTQLAMFTVQTVNRNTETRMLVAFPLHHVVLRLADESVLWTKKGSETKDIIVVSLQNSRRVFKC